MALFVSFHNLVGMFCKTSIYLGNSDDNLRVFVGINHECVNNVFFHVWTQLSKLPDHEAPSTLNPGQGLRNTPPFLLPRLFRYCCPFFTACGPCPCICYLTSTKRKAIPNVPNVYIPIQQLFVLHFLNI